MTTRRTPPDSHPHSVRDLCETFGVTPRTLRYYGAIELLPPHRVGEARFYSDADRARLAEVKRLQGMGFSLGEIHGLLILQDAGDAAGYARRFAQAGGVNLDVLRHRQAEVARSIRDLSAALDAQRRAA